MLQTIKNIIKYNFSLGNKPIYIVIHDTGNKSKGADDTAHAKYFSGGNRGASAHYFVDKDSITQLIEDFNKAWHVGDGYGKYGISNSNSIGIEICVNIDGDYNLAVQNAIDLTKHLMKVHNIDINHVVRHFDASRKLCPASMSSNNWAKWLWFKEQLVDKPVNPPVPQAVSQGELYRIRKSWADVKSQIGAYKDLNGALALAKANSGYFVFNSKGECLNPIQTEQIKPQPIQPKPIETRPIQTEKIGVVTATSLNVRSGAGTNFKSLGTLKNGEKVKISTSVKGWYNIYYGSHGGWVSADYIKIQ